MRANVKLDAVMPAGLGLTPGCRGLGHTARQGTLPTSPAALYFSDSMGATDAQGEARAHVVDLVSGRLSLKSHCREGTASHRSNWILPEYAGNRAGE